MEGAPPRTPTPPRDPALWAALLGPATGAVDAICAEHPDGPMMAGRAAHVADQSKAFERLGWAWRRLVLETEGYPYWLRWGLLVQVLGRWVAPRRPVAGPSAACASGAASAWAAQRAC